jgi:hypothetical protein
LLQARLRNGANPPCEARVWRGVVARLDRRVKHSLGLLHGLDRGADAIRLDFGPSDLTQQCSREDRT